MANGSHKGLIYGLIRLWDPVCVIVSCNYSIRVYNRFVKSIVLIISIEKGELYNMEIRNIKTFVKVVEFNSFTKAASGIGYSQATVTAHIKALEEELGVPLFDRIGKRIYLTDAGKNFMPHALNMLKVEEEALQSIRHLDELMGELRICSASSYAAAILPEFLLRFQKLHPGVNIMVKVSDFPEDTTLKLKRDEFDFLVEIDDGSAYPEFRTVYRKKENVLFVTHPKNPLLEREHISLKDLVENQLIIADRSIGYCAMLERELKKRGLELRPAMEIGSVEAIVNVLLGGFGTTFIPEYIASDYIKNGKLAEVKTDEIEVDLYVHYMCSKNKWINPIMGEFIRMLGDKDLI